jgi:hypothetical protein
MVIDIELSVKFVEKKKLFVSVDIIIQEMNMKVEEEWNKFL